MSKKRFYIYLLCILIALSQCMYAVRKYEVSSMNLKGNYTLYVEIIAPHNYSIVHGVVVIRINSSVFGSVDDSTNFATWLVIDGITVDSWECLGTFYYLWNTSGISDGIHEIVAYVGDTLGNYSSYRILVRLSNSFLNVSISAPANNSIVFGLVTVSIHSSDPNNDTTWLEIDNKVVAVWDGAGNFTYTWNTSSYVGSKHEIIAALNTTVGNISYFRIVVDVYSISDICYLTIKVSPDVSVLINGTLYRVLPVSGYFPHGSTLFIEPSGSSPWFAYDDHGFAIWFNESFNYTIPCAKNATLTLVSLYVYNMTWANGEVIKYIYDFGTTQNATKLYLEAYKVKIYGDKLFVKTTIYSNGPIEVYDITQSPFQPIVTYAYYGSSSSFLGYRVRLVEPRDFCIYNDSYMIYVHAVTQYSKTEYFFEIYNISDLSNPQLIGYLPCSENNTGDPDYFGDWVSVYNNYAIVRTVGGIYTVDISDPSNPQIAQDVMSLDVLASSFRNKHVLSDGILYVTYDYGILIMNATNLSHIVEIGEILINRTIFDIYVSDGLLFVATGYSGIYIYNVSDIDNIRMVSHIDLVETWACEYFDGFLYVADGDAGFKIFDLGNITNPVLVYHNKTIDKAVDLEYVDGSVFVSCRLAGIFQYDVSDINNVGIVNEINYLRCIKERGWASKFDQMAQMQIDIFKNYSGFPSFSFKVYGGNFYNLSFNTFVLLFPLPVLLYEDTNGDGIFTVNPIGLTENIYEYCGAEVPDKRLLVSIDDGAVCTYHDPEIVIMNNTYCVHLAIDINNISLVTDFDCINYPGTSYSEYPIRPDINNASGKANATYHFYMFETPEGVRIKVSIEIKLYDLVNITDNFSVFSGFFFYFGYASGGSVKGTPLNLTTLGFGKEIYSLFGTKTFMLDMNGNYSLIMDGQNISCGRSNISIIYPPMFYNFSLYTVSIGANFHNVSANSTIIFDPKIDVYGTTRPLLVPTQPELYIQCEYNNSWTNKPFSIHWDSSDMYYIDMFINGSYVDRLPPAGTKTLSLEEGIWRITLLGVGNGKTLERNLIAKIDTTPPKIRILSPENNSYLNESNVVICWDAYDTLSGINHYEIYVNGSLVDEDIPPNTTSYSINLDIGIYIIEVKAIDNVGNTVAIVLKVIVPASIPTSESTSEATSEITSGTTSGTTSEITSKVTSILSNYPYHTYLFITGILLIIAFIIVFRRFRKAK